MTGSKFSGTAIRGVILGITAIALPLMLAPGGFDSFRFPKVLVLRASAILLLTVYVSEAALANSRRDWADLLQDNVLKIGVFIVLWASLSAAFSSQPSVSWWAWFDLIAAFSIFVAAFDYGRASGKEVLLILLLLPGVINAGVVFLQFLDVWHPLVPPRELSELPDAGILRGAAFLGNRDDVGMYLLIPFSAALGLIRVRSRGLSIGGWIAAVILLSAIIVTTTITAIVAAMCVLWVFAAELLFKIRASVPLRIALLVALPAASLIAIAQWQPVETRIDYYIEQVSRNNWNNATGGRLEPAVAALHMTKDSPLLGVGPGRYPMEFTRVAADLRDQYPGLFSRWDPLWFDMAHNDYLEIGAEAGVPVLAAVLLLATFLFVDFMRSWRRRQSVSAIAGISCLMAVAISGTLLFPLQVAGVYGSAAILIGYCRGMEAAP